MNAATEDLQDAAAVVVVVAAAAAAAAAVGVGVVVVDVDVVVDRVDEDAQGGVGLVPDGNLNWRRRWWPNETTLAGTASLDASGSG